MLHSLVIFAVFMTTKALETDLTVDVGPGKMECFFQNIKKATGLEVEYQVIDGGDLDINFFIQAPDGKVLISEHKKSDNLHRIKMTPGDMKLCLDNTFSHFSNKLVFFEIISDEEDDSDEKDIFGEGAQEELQQIMDMTLDDFKVKMDHMKDNLDKARNLQTVLKMFEARDRNIVESNFDRVNLLSCVQLVIMVVVGLIQVIMIRNLFNDSSRVSGKLKTRT